MRTIPMLSLSRPAMIGALVLCIAVSAVAFPSSAPARQAVLTLRDAERGTSVALYDGREAGGPRGSFLYSNTQYQYFAYIFPEITTVVMVPDNDDGLILSSKDGKARLRVSGGLAEFVPGGLKGSYEAARRDAGSGIVDTTYDPAKGYWELRWKKNNTMHGRKLFIRGENMADCEISYPLAAEKQYGEIMSLILSLFNRGFY